MLNNRYKITLNYLNLKYINNNTHYIIQKLWKKLIIILLLKLLLILKNNEHLFKISRKLVQFQIFEKFVNAKIFVMLALQLAQIVTKRSDKICILPILVLVVFTNKTKMYRFKGHAGDLVILVLVFC